VANDEWVDVETAGRYLRIAPTIILRLVQDEKLTALSSPILVDRRELETCLERCRIKPGELSHLSWRTMTEGGRRTLGSDTGRPRKKA